MAVKTDVLMRLDKNNCLVFRTDRLLQRKTNSDIRLEYVMLDSEINDLPWWLGNRFIVAFPSRNRVDHRIYKKREPKVTRVSQAFAERVLSAYEEIGAEIKYKQDLAFVRY